MDPAPDKGERRQAGFGATMRAVFWSFFGVRKRKDYEHDAAHLNPVHLIVAALIGLALFIGVLVLLVHVAVSKG
jgi:amino acid transporter